MVSVVFPSPAVMSMPLPTALPPGKYVFAKDCETMTEPTASRAPFRSPTAIGRGMSDRKLESTQRAFCTMVLSPTDTLRSHPSTDMVPTALQTASISG